MKRDVGYTCFFKDINSVRLKQFDVLCQEVREILSTVKSVYLVFETGTHQSIVNSIHRNFGRFLDRQGFKGTIEVGSYLMSQSDWISLLEEVNVPITEHIILEEDQSV